VILVEIVVIALVAFRLWRLFALDTITQPLRDRLPDEGWLYEWWSCPWCATPYWAAIIYALWTVYPTFMTPVLVIGAAAAVAGLIGAKL
jgi:hypothetical protein